MINVDMKSLNVDAWLAAARAIAGEGEAGSAAGAGAGAELCPVRAADDDRGARFGTVRRRAPHGRRRGRRLAPRQRLAGQHPFAPGHRLPHLERRPGAGRGQGDGAPGLAGDPGIAGGRSQGAAGVEPRRQRQHPGARHRRRALRALQQTVRAPRPASEQCAGAGRQGVAHRPPVRDQPGRPAESDRALAGEGRQEQYRHEFHARHHRRRTPARPPRFPGDAAARQGQAVAATCPGTACRMRSTSRPSRARSK